MIEEHTTTVNGLPIHYAEVTGRGPALVLLHGITGSSQTYFPLMETLARGAHVFALDLRGHGLSGHMTGAYQLPDFGQDVANFLRLVVGGPAVIAGHSMGGLVAIWLAAREATWVRGIHLEDPPIYITQSPRLQESVFHDMLNGLRVVLSQHHADNGTLNGLTTVVGQWPAADGRSMADSLGPEPVRRRAAELHQMDPGVLDVALAGEFLGATPVDELLCLIDHPTHMLVADIRCGGALQAQDTARFLRCVPHASHTVMEGVGHGIHEEQPKTYVHALQKFLAGRLNWS